MTKRIAHDLNFTKKLGLAIAAMAALLAPIFIGMMHSPPARAQSPVPAAIAAIAAAPAPAPAATPRPRATPPVAMAPQVVAQAAMAPDPQISPTATPAEARKIRGDYAKANFRNASMVTAYTNFGTPNRKQLTGEVETWQYDYLDLYKSNVTIEFPANARAGGRVTWPPQPRFDGAQTDAAAVATLAGALGRELHFDAATAPTAGFPGGRPFIEPFLRVNRAEQFITLATPLASLSGRVDFLAQIVDEWGSVVANMRDFVDSSAGTLQGSFVVLPGSYVCNLVTREQATGLMYAATIPFVVSK